MYSLNCGRSFGIEESRHQNKSIISYIRVIDNGLISVPELTVFRVNYIKNLYERVFYSKFSTKES